MLCVTCSVDYVRSALGNVKDEVFARGLRCPMHHSSCDRMLEPANLRTLVSKQVCGLWGGGLGGWIARAHPADARLEAGAPSVLFEGGGWSRTAPFGARRATPLSRPYCAVKRRAAV